VMMMLGYHYVQDDSLIRPRLSAAACYHADQTIS
jgi:hypothetical protein